MRSRSIFCTDDRFVVTSGGGVERVPVDNRGAPCGRLAQTNDLGEWARFRASNSCDQTIRISYYCSGDRGKKAEYIARGATETMCLRKSGGQISYVFEWADRWR